MVEEEEVDQKQQQQQATTAGAAAASVDPAAQIENQPEFADLCKVDKKPKKEKKHKSDKRNKKQAVIEWERMIYDMASEFKTVRYKLV